MTRDGRQEPASRSVEALIWRRPKRTLSFVVAALTVFGNNLRAQDPISDEAVRRGEVEAAYDAEAPLKCANIITIQQNGANSGLMSALEGRVYKAVKAGEVIEYSVTPIYEGVAKAPKAITITARGSSGFNESLTVLNPVRAAAWPPKRSLSVG